MKKLTLALYTVCFSAIFNILPIHSMENHAQFAAQTEDECLLFKIPNEILFEIFLHRLSDDELSISSLSNGVKYLMSLSATCKHFNQLITLEKIAHLYKNDLNKNKVLQEIIKILDSCYRDKSSSILAQVLVHAGADVNIKFDNTSGLEAAIRLNKEKFIATLLKHGANPNVLSRCEHMGPIFFYAKKINIAQMLMDKGSVDIHATDLRGYNILYHMIDSFYSPELMNFYLKHNADATKLTKSGFCILHKLVDIYFIHKVNVKNILEKGKILLDVIPHMVNVLTINEKTPIDIAQNSFDRYINGRYHDGITQKALAHENIEKIITLFRDHGGLTAQELAERKPLNFHK